MTSTNTLVTGGTGLLGTHLLLALHQQGIRAKALYRTQIPDVVKDKAEWVQGDLNDVVGLEDLMQGIEYVYHVAGYVSFQKKDKALLQKVNVDGSATLVNACLDAGVKKLLHVSSVAALGRKRMGAPITEQMTWTPETSNSEYGKSKFLGELEAWRGFAEGLPVVVVNPVIILGEHGDWEKGSMQIFKTVYEGFAYYSLGETGFVDADDCARAMILLMHSDISGEKFILSAEGLSYRDYFFKIADGFGVRRPHKLITPFMAGLAWRLARLQKWITGKQPLVTKETAETSLVKAQFDNSKLLKALPHFTYTPLNESIQRITAVLKQKHQLK